MGYNILDKKMNRKEFLQIMLGLTISSFGLYKYIGMLGGDLPKSVAITNQQNVQHGFGSNRFGV